MADISDITAVLIALTGLVGTYTAWRLGQRGQRNDEHQQKAATKLQERIAAFDELESINDRLEKENGRLRDLVDEAEARGDLRLARQGRRCRDMLTEMTAAVATLQSVVLSEVARESAADVSKRADDHIADDHPDLDDGDG